LLVFWIKNEAQALLLLPVPHSPYIDLFVVIRRLSHWWHRWNSSYTIFIKKDD
jgi:hypothetical protein